MNVSPSKFVAVGSEVYVDEDLSRKIHEQIDASIADGDDFETFKNKIEIIKTNHQKVNPEGILS